LTSGTPQTVLATSSNFIFASDLENVATFRRSSTGALTFASVTVAIPGGTGNGSLTLDRTASHLYVGGGVFPDASYVVLDKASNGSLTFASESSTVQSVGELRFVHNNEFAYTTYLPPVNLPELGQRCTFEAFRRAADGTLTKFDPGLSRPPGVAASDFCPASVASSALGYLALAYRTVQANKGSGVHKIAVYRVLTSGKLQFVSNFVTTLDAVLPITVQFDPSGSLLAAAGTQGIQLYKLSSTGKLTKSGSALYTHTHFRDVRWDRFKHAITISFDKVYFFGVTDGQLVQTNPPLFVGGIRDIRIVSLP
jgi:6-phosphogluconolactonase (cycloisomerase 2 family)